MTAIPAVPEFQDADQYLHPLLCHGADIIRPKPRRLGDMNRPSPTSSQPSPRKERGADSQHRSSSNSPHSNATTSVSQNREGPLGGNCGPTKGSSSRSPVVKELGGSTPSLIKCSSRETISVAPSPNKAGSVSYSSVKDIVHPSVPLNANRKQLASGSSELVSAPIPSPKEAKQSKTPSPVALTTVSPVANRLTRDQVTPNSQCKSTSTSISGNTSSHHKQQCQQLPRETMSHSKSSPGLFTTTTRHQSSSIRGSPIRSPSGTSSNPSLSAGCEESRDFLPVGCALWDRHVIDEEEDEGVLPDHASYPYRDSASNTDCGSLSKSSSDGDPVICRKRMNGRLKSRRRNILSFPHILSAEEIGNNTRGVKRLETCYGGSSSDENRSSGHASMSETHSSRVSLSPVDQSSSSSPSYRHPASSVVTGSSRILNCHDYELYHDHNFASCRVDATMIHPAKETHSHHQARQIDDRNKAVSTGGRGTPLKSVPEDDKLVTVSGSNISVPKPTRRSTSSSRKTSCTANTNHHRQPPTSKDDVLLSFESAGGVEDLRQAIEQLSTSRHNNHSFRTSYSTSTYSSASGASDIVTEAGVARRLMRHSSMDTINTNITSADEFVWIDSHNRLVELQQAPWSNRDILRVLQGGRLKENLGRVSMETVPRLTYLLQRPLVRLAREAQRFSRSLGMCSKQEVSGAIRVVFSPSLADSSIKACHRAAAIYTVISGDVPRQSKSARAGLHLSVGRFHRWMCDVHIGNFVQEYAAVYLTAAIENLLEEIVLQSLPPDGKTVVSASLLEAAIAANSDLWGLLQPFSHLNAGRTATGALSLPNWPGHSDGQSSSASSSTSPTCGGISSRSSSSSQLQPGDSPSDSPRTGIPKSIEQNLLTTCVGGINELGDILARVVQYYNKVLNAATSGRQSVSWGPGALHALYYFMRCSQLEHADHVAHRVPPVQELVYERPYLVLPPLVEWVRVATAHTEHRRCHVIDKDDVMQAARLLLPGVDCPVRYLGSYDEKLFRRKPLDETDCARILKTDLAFRMLSCGRTDLVSHALQLLPPTRLNTMNEHGHTALMLACIRSDEAMAHVLLDAAADLDIETPHSSNIHPSVNSETQHWTALTYATTQGHLGIIKLLLEKGANPEGGARLSEEKITETPLQLATAAGKFELCSLLLFYGADPFLSTAPKDLLSCYGGSSQRGCFSAISVAAAHGQRAVLHKLLSHPRVHHSKSSREEVLSLEEILAEGSNSSPPISTGDNRSSRLQLIPMNTEEANWSGCGNGQTSSNTSGNSETNQVLKLNKAQLRVLQEAMYHSAENGHLEITLDLRNIGVPWTLHCWMYTLATAHDLQLGTIIDQLLQDFLQIWPEDCSSQFVDECLPLLFNIFRHSKNEGTSLLLADIFSSCYGKDPIKPINHVSIDGGARIDPKYVNNPEMSDVQFRLEGRVFYAHKIILVNASPRFRAMLASKVSDGTTPIVQITDIRYEIFQVIMEFLYKGGCEGFQIHNNDVLELMAAASFFQLDGLLRYCEARCSQLIDADNLVSIYIHAKAYNAVQLLEYCQGFLLQNTVSLLTYDDSVRKLIFGKKLHNHDVLSGLLLTLQARIKRRCANNNKQQNSASCLAIHQKKI